ncbi:Trm112 family protein [Coxiella endosymbiont of Amblyomma americanum]|uniref:Trm112 family protein n=1 Tax=Coxiella endosymbiont of Amblyomma americanum TaxID=325775 RepID=UPI000A025E61|nr:Trm112 family protein [Coxiella endosymbiont of Amblyomma americanum]AUJ59029.1 hypothetical protein B1F76_01075 [Coxiella-like endosymbiont of Amblyomma americanum]
MDKKLLEILVCPLCRGKLVYNQETEELHCQVDQVAYPIKEGIPIMLTDKTRAIINEE